MPRSHTLPAARALALLRLVAGGILLLAASGKMAWYWLAGTIPLPVTSVEWQRDLPARLTVWLQSHPTGVLASIVRDLLLPNGLVVAGLVAWAQCLAGALLVVGLFTRASAALAGIVVAFLALLASTQDGNDWRPYVLLLALAIALVIGDAGQTFGWDGVRRERRKDFRL